LLPLLREIVKAWEQELEKSQAINLLTGHGCQLEDLPGPKI
jgi:hypothetical protein